MSRMNSIRDLAKGMAPVLKVAGAAGIGAAAAGAGIGMYTGKDMTSTGNLAQGAAMGALAGMSAGALSAYARGMPGALRAARATGSWKGGFNSFKSTMSGIRPSMTNTAIGGVTGMGLGLGYATLQSNKPVGFDERLKFEQKRKQMAVDENLRQFKEMRQIMADTRLR